jgi:hypothetical protein
MMARPIKRLVLFWVVLTAALLTGVFMETQVVQITSSHSILPKLDLIRVE